MFRKIHSSRDPQDTVFSELKKQFGVHFTDALAWSIGVFKRHPKPIFALMILCMVCSMVLSFTVFRNREVGKALPVRSAGVPLRYGFGSLMNQGAALRRSLLLKEQIELLIGKDSLGHTDSIQLSKAIDELRELSIHLNAKP